MTADTAKKSDVLPADTAGALKQENAQVNADVNLWQPVIKELSAFNSTKDSTNSSLWSIFFMGVLGGFIALLTPCVWPIIPMTVSFFLKRAKDDRKKGIRDAVTYGLSKNCESIKKLSSFYGSFDLLDNLAWREIRFYDIAMNS